VNSKVGGGIKKRPVGSKKGIGCGARKGAKQAEDGQSGVISSDRDAVTDSSFDALRGGWSM
jgi:hypothetical protein